MVRRLCLLLPLTIAVGCSPMNVEVISGEYRAYLSEQTSFSLQKGTIDLESDDFDMSYNIDCRDLAADVKDENGNGSKQDEIDALKLPDALDICDKQDFKRPTEKWIDNTAYRVVGQDFVPWRAEGIITGEGDLQLSFHQRVPGGGDFRFGVVLDPDFQPTACQPTEDGTTESYDVDGSWLDGWKADLQDIVDDENRPEALSVLGGYDGGQLYYLNANSFQIDPTATPEDGNTDKNIYWSLPTTWRAGWAEGKFADELISARPSVYGNPALQDNTVDLGRANQFYCGDGLQGFGCPKVCNSAVEVAENASEILRFTGPDAGDSDPWYSPLATCNKWRDPDGSGPLDAGDFDDRAEGLDGWTEVHYNYVALKEGASVEPGGSVEGYFSLYFEGLDSVSRVFVSGEFKIDRIKKDTWTDPDLHAIKLAEDGTQACGG